jgi:catechol-2,3-dioxygenase
MKFKEYLVMAALLVPTASVLTGMVVSVTAERTMPAEASVRATSLAMYYADLEKQP